MIQDKETMTADVMEAVLRRQPLCQDFAVDDPVTVAEVLAAFEAKMAQRPDIGVVNRALNLLLQPRNPFEPKRPRRTKMETLVLGMLLAAACAAFLFFNLAAPRLQVHP